MNELATPCGQLHTILSLVVETDFADSQPVANVWKAVAGKFEEGLSSEDLILRMASLSLFARDMILQDGVLSEDRKNLFLKKISQAERAWSVLGNFANAQALKNYLKSSPIDDLLIVDEVLKVSGSKLSGAESLTDLRLNAGQLLSDVMASDAGPEIKAVVLVCLRGIINAIDYRSIQGEVGVIKAITRAKAEFSVFEKEIKSISSGEDRVGQKIKDFIDGAYNKARDGAANIGVISAYVQTAPALLGFSSGDV